jgi:hypothetical protein
VIHGTRSFGWVWAWMPQSADKQSDGISPAAKQLFPETPPPIAHKFPGDGPGVWGGKSAQKAGIDDSSLLLEHVEYDPSLEQSSMVMLSPFASQVSFATNYPALHAYILDRTH